MSQSGPADVQGYQRELERAIQEKGLHRFYGPGTQGAQKLPMIAQRAAQSVDPARIAAVMHDGRTFRTVLGDLSFDAKGDPKTPDFTVYAWYRLADLPASARSDVTPLVAGRQVIAGTPYAQALGASLPEGTSAVSTWSLGNRCLSLRAVIGATDDSDPVVAAIHSGWLLLTTFAWKLRPAISRRFNTLLSSSDSRPPTPSDVYR